MQIKIKYFSKDIEKLRYIENKSDWIDLRAAKDIELKAGEFALIPLGIGMQLPKGYEYHVLPRSYTFKNFKQEEIILFEYYLKRVFENLENLL